MRNLFRPPDAAMLADTEAAMRAIRDELGLSSSHARGLPYAIRDLSRLLTTERAQLEQPYWSSARLLAAYCAYFLPWNLHRLSWLLPGLRLDIPSGARILDLGSGPLTVPLALWIARPDLRETPLHFTCTDVAPHPLEKGRAIFRRLAGDESPWQIRLERAPVESALRGFSGKADLICAANVLNEIPAPKNAPLESRLEAFATLAHARLAANGRILSVEPGTRLGGKLVSLLRRAGIGCGLLPESPCPHALACPMLESRTGWCHFSHPAGNAPPALLELAKRAKLPKTSLSLSCMVLRPARPDEEEALERFQDAQYPDLDSLDQDGMDDFDSYDDRDAEEAIRPRPLVRPEEESPTGFVRILSDPIRLPDRREPGRYACTAKGLGLVLDAARLPSGAALSVHWPEPEERDPKTGALLIPFGREEKDRRRQARASALSGDDTPDRSFSRPEVDQLPNRYGRGAGQEEDERASATPRRQGGEDASGRQDRSWREDGSRPRSDKPWQNSRSGGADGDGKAKQRDRQGQDRSGRPSRDHRQDRRPWGEHRKERDQSDRASSDGSAGNDRPEGSRGREDASRRGSSSSNSRPARKNQENRAGRGRFIRKKGKSGADN